MGLLTNTTYSLRCDGEGCARIAGLNHHNIITLIIAAKRRGWLVAATGETYRALCPQCAAKAKERTMTDKTTEPTPTPEQVREALKRLKDDDPGAFEFGAFDERVALILRYATQLLDATPGKVRGILPDEMLALEVAIAAFDHMIDTDNIILDPRNAGETDFQAGVQCQQTRIRLQNIVDRAACLDREQRATADQDAPKPKRKRANAPRGEGK